MPYDYKPFDYVPPAGLSGAEPRHRVAIVGAEPIGLAMAVELANHGIEAVVLDDNNVLGRQPGDLLVEAGAGDP